MIHTTIEKERGIALLEPDGKLSAKDFVDVARIIDPWLEEGGACKGIVIHTEHFPGWDSFAALSDHLKFVKAHHKKVARVAICTDSKVAGIAKKIASPFVHAEIGVFDYADLAKAKDWAASQASAQA